MNVRPAHPDDVPRIYQLMTDLARYEKAEHEVTSSTQDLARALFGDRPHVFCHVTESGGEIVGFALWFLNFSTWMGSSGLFVEDLYVDPAHRGRGHGLALMRTLARACHDNGWTRFEWSVLDWNRPAINFYRRIGAVAMEEWTKYRLSGAALQSLADSIS